MTTPKAVLVDTTLCTGCEECITACKKENNLGDDHPWRGQGRIDGLSKTRWSTIPRRPGNHFVRNQCRHCLEPACVSACIVGALTKRPEGPVDYNLDRCMGCRYCMLACPYGIPRYDWDLSTPLIQKCRMCAPRVTEGRPPACVEACPEKAIVFGTRPDLLAEAHRRIESDPKKYQPRVWGESEFGGTSFLYVSDIPLDFLAWDPATGDRPYPDLSWAALKKVPGIIVGVGALMAGTYWMVGRRMKLAAMRNEAAAAEAPADADTEDPDSSTENPETRTEKNDE